MQAPHKRYDHNMEATPAILGIDLGGTHVRAGLVQGDRLSSIASQRIQSQDTAEAIAQQLFTFIDPFITPSVSAIGIGVPGLVDPVSGIVFDVVNIPAWREVPLQQWMQDRYHLPVALNNDANCFALGEFYFGKGRGHDSMIGLTIGTGLGSGIILDKKLYAGKHGGAGEFGMIPYLDHCYEYYASGQFFQNVYGLNGETVFSNANQGDAAALKMYVEMGMHLGKAIQTILYTLDIDLVILGGSVRHAFRHFSPSLWHEVRGLAYKRAVEELRIEVSELENSGILGAAALVYDMQ